MIADAEDVRRRMRGHGVSAELKNDGIEVEVWFNPNIPETRLDVPETTVPITIRLTFDPKRYHVQRLDVVLTGGSADGTVIIEWQYDQGPQELRVDAQAFESVLHVKGVERHRDVLHAAIANAPADFSGIIHGLPNVAVMLGDQPSVLVASSVCVIVIGEDQNVAHSVKARNAVISSQNARLETLTASESVILPLAINLRALVLNDVRQLYCQGQVRIDEVSQATSLDDPLTVMRFHRDDERLQSHSLHVAHTGDLSVRLPEGGELVITHTAQNLQVEVGRIRLESLASVERLVAGASSDLEIPVIVADDFSSILSLEGDVLIERVWNSQIIGHLTRGFRIHGVSTSSLDSPPPIANRGPFYGSIIENVRIDEEIPGAVSLWSSLADAAYVIPVLEHTSVNLYRWRFWPLLFTFGPRTADARQFYSPQQVYVHAMADVIERKGAPGGVRSRVAWASYRLRGFVAPSVTERVVLAAYRCIGYGERPAPAFATWFLASLLFAIFSAPRGIDMSSQGFGNYLTELKFWLLSPVGLINLVQSESEAKTAPMILGHLFVAIPFLTGVFALRRFVKADRPG